MSDLDRYLTDEVRERAAEAIASHNFDVHVPSWSIRCAGYDYSIYDHDLPTNWHAAARRWV
ncbi:hypothetical protein [Collinsella sp. LCP19S3_G10]|uniref:hypothetical protein n=1 Tax=Collinsella sp. LCP19S3_G10 TaxID=3438766 RepID=UPI003F8DE472